MMWSLLFWCGAPAVALWPRRIGVGRDVEDPLRRPLLFGRRKRRVEDECAREVLTVLELQIRLGQLTQLLREIDVDTDRFARQHHWRTTLWAYDSILADACALAGVEVIEAEAGPKADAERTRRELELCACGWNW